MQPLSIALGDRSYPIYIGRGILDDRARFDAHLPGGALCIVTNTTVAPLYLARLRRTLAGRRVIECVIEDGEQYKTLATLSRIFDCLVEGRVHRDGCVLALGGGVVGDLAGFAAACYQRGIACAQIPTTLLAQVDSSVGGKTAVDHPGGKNLIGAFHQPCAVYADTDVLGTLPARDFSAGLAEVIKYGLIEDAGFFDWLERSMPALLGRDPQALAHAIRRSCEIKARIVAEDERETTGRRALLNLGHTFGHAIETAVGYSGWLHGEAVAVGMLLAARLSSQLGLLPADDVSRLQALLVRAGLPVSPPPLPPARLWELMQMDKKAMDGRVTLVLLDRIGHAVLNAQCGAAQVLPVLAP